MQKAVLMIALRYYIGLCQDRLRKTTVRIVGVLGKI
jgi:hypothetical protein